MISMDTQAETQTELEEEVEEPLELPRAISQWASHVISRSSSYEHGWNAECICGPPRVFPHYGDVCCCYFSLFFSNCFVLLLFFVFRSGDHGHHLLQRALLNGLNFVFRDLVTL